MIRSPRRAVTRFLIPFIDVLILLFCIFLLMPFVSRPDSSHGASVASPETAEQQDQLRRELANVRRINEVLRKRLENPLSGLVLHVLEIDKDTGKLFTAELRGGNRIEIADTAQAAHFIAASSLAARPGQAGFLLRFPRELSGFPLRQQFNAYRSWFRGTPHVFDAQELSGSS